MSFGRVHSPPALFRRCSLQPRLHLRAAQALSIFRLWTVVMKLFDLSRFWPRLHHRPLSNFLQETLSNFSIRHLRHVRLWPRLHHRPLSNFLQETLSNFSNRHLRHVWCKFHLPTCPPLSTSVVVPIRTWKLSRGLIPHTTASSINHANFNSAHDAGQGTCSAHAHSCAVLCREVPSMAM